MRNLRYVLLASAIACGGGGSGTSTEPPPSPLSLLVDAPSSVTITQTSGLTVPIVFRAQGGDGGYSYTLSEGASTLYTGSLTVYNWNLTLSTTTGIHSLTAVVKDSKGQTSSYTFSVTVGVSIPLWYVRAPKNSVVPIGCSPVGYIAPRTDEFFMGLLSAKEDSVQTCQMSGDAVTNGAMYSMSSAIYTIKKSATVTVSASIEFSGCAWNSTGTTIYLLRHPLDSATTYSSYAVTLDFLNSHGGTTQMPSGTALNPPGTGIILYPRVIAKGVRCLGDSKLSIKSLIVTYVEAGDTTKHTFKGDTITLSSPK